MKGMRFSSLAVLVFAIVAMGLWVAGCTDQKASKLLLPQHGAQTTPSGVYSVTWSDVDVAGAGRVVVPGKIDVTLAPEQVKDLAHSLFNINATGHHGWEVTPLTDANDVVRLAVDPHPHGAAKLLLSYDAKTGQAEGYFEPFAFPARSAALNTLMKEFIVRVTGLQHVQDVTVTGFEAAAVNYSIHWKPDALEFVPVEIAYPDLIGSGVTIEGTFYAGETQGSFSATIERMSGDARGVQVAECPECMPGVPKPVVRPQIGVEP